jgi:hypothetical protein
MHEPLDSINTCDLAAPHTVAFGMAITFRVEASIGFDTQIQTRFILATVGADSHALTEATARCIGADLRGCRRPDRVRESATGRWGQRPGV